MFMIIISKDYRKIITVNFKLFQMSKTNVLYLYSEIWEWIQFFKNNQTSKISLYAFLETNVSCKDVFIEMDYTQ